MITLLHDVPKGCFLRLRSTFLRFLSGPIPNPSSITIKGPNLNSERRFFLGNRATNCAILGTVSQSLEARLSLQPTPKKTKAKVNLNGNLQTIMKAIIKDKGTMVLCRGNQIPKVTRTPTGVFEWDFQLGGGFPNGRYSIIYGPESSNKTNICYLAVAQAQRRPALNNKAVWVSLEQTFDPVWAAKLGVDVEALIVVNPGYGEEAVDIIDALVRAEDVAILVVDSMAALISSKEVEQSVEKADVMSSALLTKRMVNKLMIAFSEESKRGHFPCVLLVNQIRYKMTMFGKPRCLHGDTVVNFIDGQARPIREVVKNKIFGAVWSYNEETASFVAANIVGHHYNGQAKAGELVTITSEALDTKNGVLSATVSYTHKVLTSQGWKVAADISPGDKLITKYESKINGTLREFLIGTGCGDITFAVPNKGGKRAQLKLEDSVNPEYAAWKAKLLRPFFPMMDRPNDSGSIQFLSSPRTDLFFLKKQFQGCRHPQILFEEFSWLSFAMWIMDDGSYRRDRYTLSIGRFRNDPEARDYISLQLETLHLKHNWHQDKSVVFTTSSSQVIAWQIRKYVPACMSYKAPFGSGSGIEALEASPKVVQAYVNVIKAEPSAARKYREPGYFDLSVDGPNNYLVGNLDNGFVVHNSNLDIDPSEEVNIR